MAVTIDEGPHDGSDMIIPANGPLASTSHTSSKLSPPKMDLLGTMIMVSSLAVRMRGSG